MMIEMADTVLLPIGELQKLANVRIPNTYGNALDYLAKYNVYTFNTGQQLTIRGVIGLDSAGADGGGRMIVLSTRSSYPQAARADAASLPASVPAFGYAVRHPRHLPCWLCRGSASGCHAVR